MLTGARDQTCKRTLEPGAQLPLYQIARTTKQANQAQGQTTCYLDPNTGVRSKQAKVRTPTVEKRTHTERGRAARPDLARTQRTVTNEQQENER
jgi:hypothetical protein